jgi:hypothetical protein
VSCNAQSQSSGRRSALHGRAFICPALMYDDRDWIMPRRRASCWKDASGEFLYTNPPTLDCFALRGAERDLPPALIPPFDQEGLALHQFRSLFSALQIVVIYQGDQHLRDTVNALCGLPLDRNRPSTMLRWTFCTPVLGLCFGSFGVSVGGLLLNVHASAACEVIMQLCASGLGTSVQLPRFAAAAGFGLVTAL